MTKSSCIGALCLVDLSEGETGANVLANVEELIFLFFGLKHKRRVESAIDVHLEVLALDFFYLLWFLDVLHIFLLKLLPLLVGVPVVVDVVDEVPTTPCESKLPFCLCLYRLLSSWLVIVALCHFTNFLSHTF